MLPLPPDEGCRPGDELIDPDRKAGAARRNKENAPTAGTTDREHGHYWSSREGLRKTPRGPGRRAAFGAVAHSVPAGIIPPATRHGKNCSMASQFVSRSSPR